jgi:hypothetical protein
MGGTIIPDIEVFNPNAIIFFQPMVVASGNDTFDQSPILLHDAIISPPKSLSAFLPVHTRQQFLHTPVSLKR